MKWQKREAPALSPELIDEFQLSPLAAKLFSLRGCNTEEKLKFWFQADETDLADPSLMHDLDRAVARINQAIDQGEKITIYGDYDADGITATTIMVDCLSILGADVHYFIPDRFKDGYGPSLKRYQQIVADGTKLIITVDNGITGVKEVAYAKEHGVDTIISDHHTLQDPLPAAYAIVHCNYPGQSYPFDDYCGAGVAYTICRKLMDEPMPELLDLAMIGTIGDMVKVSGEGHIIVRRGLEVLNQTERPGLRALIKTAGLKLGQIDEEDVGFMITPRLNATGRMASANLAVQLLLSEDEVQAQALAEKIEKLNNQRKDLTNQIFQACQKQVQEHGWLQAKTLVIYQPDFHEGILGLVANKLVEHYHKPAIVLTKGQNDEVKGSGRSIPGFNLFDALSPLKGKILTKFGGHDFACGLSLKEEQVADLRQAFAANFKVSGTLPPKQYDGELKQNPDLTAFKAMQTVGPFGTDNPAPVFSITGATIKQLFAVGKDKNHIKFKAQLAGGSLDIIGFNMGFLNSRLLPFVHRLYVKLSLNRFRNQTKVQGQLLDLDFAAPKLAAPQTVIDLRQESYVMGFADRYLFFDSKNLEQAQNNYALSSDQLQLVQDYQGDARQAVLLDLPHSQAQLNQALAQNYQQLYLRFLLDQLPVKRMPVRRDFAAVLSYLYQHPVLRPSDYRQVAPFLGLDYDSVLFILRVFFELGFVKLDQGKLVGLKPQQKKSLTASNYFLATRSQLQFAQKLRLMPSKELLTYIKQFRQ
jgi:single-stranded-DNA-specific exonuclease